MSSSNNDDWQQAKFQDNNGFDMFDINEYEYQIRLTRNTILL